MKPETFGTTLVVRNRVLTYVVKHCLLSLNSMGAVSSLHPRDILVETSDTRDGPCEDATRMSGVLGDFTVQLATRLPDWLASGLLRCIVLPACPRVVSFSKFHEPDKHDLLRTSR